MSSSFLAKNAGGSGQQKILSCRVRAVAGQNDGSTNPSQAEIILDCNCLADDPSSVNLRKLQEAQERKRLQALEEDTSLPIDKRSPEQNAQEVAQARSLIMQLLEKRSAEKARGFRGQKGLVSRGYGSTGRELVKSSTGRRLPKWITLEDGIFVYGFNVFNNDPGNVDMEKLTSLVRAIEKDSLETYAKDYGCRAVFDIYDHDAMKNPALFQGDRLAIFVGQYGNGAFHYVNTPEPTNTYSFPTGGGKLAGYGVNLPNGSNFDFVPYSIISSNDVPKFIGNPENIYAISKSTLPKDVIQDVYHQIIATAFSHEVKEILSDDTTLNWVLFDHYAPTVANWHWGIFDDPRDKYHCTNGVKGKGENAGYLELPSFLKTFPTGGLFFAVKEVGDVVSAGFASLLNSYNVDGWLIQNHPLATFWQPYNSTSELKYDHIGHVKFPMEPYGGLHQLIFFISFDDAKTHLLEVQNKGPITASMRNAHPDNNFPPNYVIVRQLSQIEKSSNVLALIESLENYGPSEPDRT